HKPSGPPGCGDDPQPDMNVTFRSAAIMNDLQAGVNAGWGTYTVALTEANSSGGGESGDLLWKKFDPGRVTMTVTFDHAPGVPSGLSLTASNAAPAGCVSGPNRPVITSTTPTFHATFGDQDGQDSLWAHWEWQATDGSQHSLVTPGDAHPVGVEQSVSVP